MAWRGQSLLCVGDAHQIVYDQKRGEIICSKCGLVVEERKIETETSGLVRRYASRRKRISRKTALSALRCSNPRSTKGSLRKLFEEKSHPLIVQVKAVELFKSVYKTRLVTGYDASIVAKALLYSAYRLSHVPMVLSEISASQKERRKIARCYNKICARLESRAPKLEYRDYLSVVATRTKVDRDTEVLANKILVKVGENRLLGSANPVGIAATALYLAGALRGRRVTQKDVAMAAGMSEVTIRGNFRLIRAHSELQCCL